VFAIRKHDPRKKGKGDETPTYSVEVLSAPGQLLASASSMGVHGKVLPGGSFGGVSWSANEEFVCYVAEPVADKDKDKDKGDAKNGGGKEGGAGASKEKKLEWEHEQDWGEQFVGIKSPRAFVFNVKERCIVQIKGVPDNLSLAQVRTYGHASDASTWLTARACSCSLFGCLAESRSPSLGTRTRRTARESPITTLGTRELFLLLVPSSSCVTRLLGSCFRLR
jgi:hypothetical protein